MENDLQENVSQLFFHIRIILLANGLLEFSGFLYEVLQQTLMGLFAVPGAALGRPQFSHHTEQFGKGILTSFLYHSKGELYKMTLSLYWTGGGIGIRAGLRSQFLTDCGFESRPVQYDDR